MKNGALSLYLIFFVCSFTSTAQRTEAVRDIDGNEYRTVTIGTQTWMAENLKVTKYNDGTVIKSFTNDKAWWSTTTSAYSWMENNEKQYKDIYGALYNWYAVNTGKLCPIGWRVPADSDWKVLIEYLGGENVAGIKLKDSGKAFWRGPNTGTTNETGFTALPAGLRYFKGFYAPGINGTWWSSTSYTTTSAWYRTMDYKFTSVDRYHFDKRTGFSVRCLSDSD